MPHLHTGKGEHDLTVSAYIMRTDFAEPKLMLHWHKKLHTYIQFGGHVELTENPWQAIAHEIKEESGYSMPQLRLLQPKTRLKKTVAHSVLHPQPVCINTHPFSEDHFHIDIDYAFVTDQEPESKVGEGESSDFKLVSRAELIEMDGDNMLEGVREIALFIFDECLPNWERVPTSS